MSDEEKTAGLEDNSDDQPLDPLGVIGWVIGGKYKIRSYIGGGGFGEVYGGYNVNLIEQKLVIKFFKKVQARDKFDKEAKILCLLDHPNICRVIDYLPEEGALVVAFIDGQDGKKILRDSGPLSSDMLLKVGRTMTDALAYAHEKKIAHRDVKPDNILIDKNDNVYLIDFGIAKVMKEDATKTAYQALTPMFAAPERQGGDSNYNPFLSDIYETGVTLFNFATNEMPYRNPANPDIHEWGGPKAKNLSPQMAHVLKKATHPDPNKRYESIAEMGKDIAEVRQVYGGKSRKPVWITTVIIILLAGGAFLTHDRWLPAAQSFMESTEFSEIISDITDGISKEETSQDTTVSETKVAADGQLTTTDNQQESNEKNTDSVVIEENADSKDKQISDIDSSAVAVVSKEETKPEPEPEPEKPKPPPLPKVTIGAIPKYNLTILFDGVEKSPNVEFEAGPGVHEITIIHPDFPILSDQVQTNVNKKYQYNLQNEFSQRDTLRFFIGAIPPELGDALLEVLFNGHGNKYSADRLPAELNRLSGEWNLGFSLKNAQDNKYAGVKIDSAITFPYGGGPREFIRGEKSTVDFGDAKWQNVGSITLLVYWSKN